MLAALDCDTSFGRLLGSLRGVFTAPSFETFRAMVVGLVCQVGECTVTGMLTAAGMSTTWDHNRAHRFFSRAVWSLDELGLQTMSLIVRLLVDASGSVRLALDDTLFLRSGPNVADAFWQHDGASAAPGGIGYGNNFVVLGVLVWLPFLRRPVCLPVLFRIYRKGGPSRAELGNQLVWIATTFLQGRGRRVELVADAAYATQAFVDLPDQVSFVSRLRSNAALFRLKPPPTGKRGRPREKGTRLPSLADIARDKRRRWKTVTVTRYGRVEQVQALTLVCLWYTVFKSRPVRVVLIHESGSGKAFDFALISSNPDASVEHIIERYAERWAIEIAFRDAKQTTGVGEARNRVRLAVERTVPFGLIVQSLVTIWYATCGHTDAVVAERRQRAPWYDQKTEPSWLDMLATLRRQLITDHFRATPHPTDDLQEIPDPAWALELLAS